MAIFIALLMMLNVVPLDFAIVKAAEEAHVEIPTGFIPIYTVSDLAAIGNDLSGNYILMNDIDLTDATSKTGDYSYSGKGWMPIGGDATYSNLQFEGVFEGNNYSIKGLQIYGGSNGNETYYGLFANNSGTIKNLIVSDVYIQNEEKSCSVSNYAGTVAAYNSGTIENCKSSGNINLSCYKENYVGGLTGLNSGNISKCCSNVSIISNYKRNDYCNGRNENIGGIAGKNTGYISICYNTGEVDSYSYNESYNGATSAWSYAGGIVGCLSSGEVTNCYNIAYIKSRARTSGEIYYGNVYSKACSGGIVGKYHSGDVNKCYNSGKVWASGEDSETHVISGGKEVCDCYFLSGIGDADVGSIALTNVQFQQEKFMSKLDFNAIWIIDENTEYKFPQLRDNRQDTEKIIDIIEWKSLPSKISYYNNAKLIDSTGGIITVYYIDGTSEDKKVTTEMLSGYDFAKVGTQTISMTYRDKILSYQIEVTNAPNIVSVSQISGPEKTEFVRGTAFDFSGWKLNVIFDNATSEVIDVTPDMVSGGNIDASGIYDVTVSYGEKTFMQTVNVIPVKLIGINIKTMPTKTSYIQGENLNIEGMVVEAVYNNGTKKNITEYIIEGDVSALGTNSITIKFSGFETSFDVEVIKGTPIDISITTLPNKVQYVDGQSLDLQGLVVEATFSNGFVKEIKDYEVSKMKSGIGSQNITISYGELSTYFSINVIQKQLQSIEVTHLPNKTTYVEGEQFIAEGLVISGLYNDSSKSEITNYSISGNNTTAAGNRIVTVTYSGKIVTFPITVIVADLVEIKVIEPTKKEYLIDEQLDLTGINVTAVYTNGREEKVNNYSTSGYTGEVGTNIVKISYEDKEYFFTVIVHELYGEWKVVKEATCEEKGSKVKYCRDCGKVVISEELPANGHTEETDESVDSTCSKTGLTEGKHCSVCNKIFMIQEIIGLKKHTIIEIPKKYATTQNAGYEAYYRCDACGKIFSDLEGKKEIKEPVLIPKIESKDMDGTPTSPVHKPVKKGDLIKSVDASYTVTNVTYGKTEVEYAATTSYTATTVTIPDTITLNGVKYKVTSIKANAFKNNKNIKTIVIGKNIKKIGKNAFYGCKNLKTITIKSTKLSIKTVGKNSFAKINKKVQIKVSKKKLKLYKKLLKARGIKSNTQKITK